jgi:hypothetical protein
VFICIGYLTWLQVNWSAVWRIRAPPKVKHVLQRLYSNVCPVITTASRLFSFCLQCTAEPEEDDLHSFITCPTIRDSWAAAGLGAAVYYRLHNVVSIAGLLSNICSNEESNLARQVAMHLWCLWQNRNDKVRNYHTLSFRSPSNPSVFGKRG